MECAYKNCHRDEHARGYCKTHYEQNRTGSEMKEIIPNYIGENNPNFKHGGYTKYKSEYNSWRAMKERCDKPQHAQYSNYGGRGIKYQEDWVYFENFLKDMGKKPTSKHSIDRIDTNGNYTKDNCRWATPKQQGQNTRTNVKINVDGKELHISEVLDKFDVPLSTFYKIIRIRKVSHQEAFDYWRNNKHLHNYIVRGL